MAETWLINENPAETLNEFTIMFSSNNKEFDGIKVDSIISPYGYVYVPSYHSPIEGWLTTRFPSGEWVTQDYRIVTFETAPTSRLFYWLYENAVKQVSGYSITYHANGGIPTPENLTEQTQLPDPLPVVSKQGYAFAGWYLDSTFEAKAVAGASIEADTNLYAKFMTLSDLFTETADAIRSKKGGTDSIVALDFPSEIENLPSGGGIEGGYNVKLVVDGEDWSVVSVKAGEAIKGLTNPEKSQMAFIGWATTEGATLPDVTLPYTPTADTTLYAVFNQSVQYKASPVGYGSSSPSSVTFSPNSNLANWTPEVVTKDGDTFLKFPTFYRKVVASSSGQITSFIISSWKEDSEFEPYPCFLDESGNLLPYILIGKYMSNSSSTMVSTGTPGQASGKVAQTIANGRQHARARGTGYQLYDWQMQKLWQDLICAKMQTININTGSGILTDALGLEWEKSGSWIDGIGRTADNHWAFSYKPSAYVDQPTGSTTGYQVVNYSAPTSGSSGSEISKLGYDTSHPFVNYPNTITSNSSFNTYYCDAYYFNSSSAPVFSGVGLASANYGAFDCSSGYTWSGTYGVRLCYRPL